MSNIVDTTSPDAGATNGRQEVTTAFLRAALAGGAMTIVQLDLKAREAGLLGERQTITHAKSFKRAKKVLGIRSVRTGFAQSGEWWWVLSGPLRARTTPRSQGGTMPGSGIPLEWAIGVDHLDYHRAPAGIRLHLWRQFVDDCNSFLASAQNGAARAAALGWDTYALFGCGPTHPLAHLGSAGLLWTINGGRIVELHREWAVVEVAGSESRVTYNRPRADTSNVRLPWELTSFP
jgi:hypothetical protein